MILSVLKIIGLILLIILILIIFILGLLLFVPIRYQFMGSCDRKFEGEARVKWMPVLLRIDVSFRNNHLRYLVRLFGGVVMTNTGVKLSWIGRRFFSFTEETALHTAEALTGDENLEQKDFCSDRESSTDACKEISDKQDRKNERISITDRIRKRIQSLKKGWQSFFDSLRKINSKKEDLLKVYHSKRFDTAKRDIQGYAKELFLIIKPKRLEGYVHFGTEDPALTGQILGGLAFFLPFYQEFLMIQPDFQEKCLEGNLKGKGKIFLFPVVKLLLKVILNKNLIKVTKKVQTIIEA